LKGAKVRLVPPKNHQRERESKKKRKSGRKNRLPDRWHERMREIRESR